MVLRSTPASVTKEFVCRTYALIHTDQTSAAPMTLERTARPQPRKPSLPPLPKSARRPLPQMEMRWEAGRVKGNAAGRVRRVIAVRYQSFTIVDVDSFLFSFSSHIFPAIPQFSWAISLGKARDITTTITITIFDIPVFHTIVLLAYLQLHKSIAINLSVN
jgi:hypothetical protein